MWRHTHARTHVHTCARGRPRRRPQAAGPGSAAAAAERDGLAAAGPPGSDAAVEYRPGVDTARREHARRDCGPGARLADRHYRQAAGEAVLGRLANHAVGNVATAGDVGAIVLVRVAHVHELDLARGKERRQLVDLDR